MKSAGRTSFLKKAITVFLLFCLSCALCAGTALSAHAAQSYLDVALTAEDRQFISAQQPIRVAINRDLLPLEGYDSSTGTCIGFVVNLLESISAQSGLQFSMIRTDSLSAAAALLEQGSVDMVAGYDPATQLLPGAPCSDIYLKASLLIVGSKQFRYDGSRIVIALSAQTQYLTDDLLQIYPGSDFLVCNTSRELFDAVQTGKADVLVRNVYSVQSELAGRYPNLAIIYDTEKLAQYRFAFSAGADARLVDLLNRYIAALSESEKNQMLVTSTLSDLNTIGAAQIIWPLMLAVIVITLFLLVLVVLVIQLRRKTLKIEDLLSQKNEYDEILSSRAVLEGMFDTVYEADLTNDLAGGPACRQTQQRLGLPANCTYTRLMQAVAEQVVQDAYKPLYLDTFDRDHILSRFLAGDATQTVELVCKQDPLTFVWNRITLCAYRSKVSDAVKAVVYVKNIQAEKESEQALIDAASTDAMTGVYNKHSALRLIDQVLAHSRPAADFHALLVMDIDRFKMVNDTLGHSIGDEVLKSVAGMIKSCFREGDIVGRIGGDEFLVFMKDCKTAEAAVRRARELLSLLHATYGGENSAVNPTLSIGIALYPVHADTYTDLFSLADTALYAAKNGGRNSFRVFSGTEKLRTDIRIGNQRLQEAIGASADGLAKYALTDGLRILYRTELLLSALQLPKTALPPETDTAPYLHPQDRDKLCQTLRDAYQFHRGDTFTATFRVRQADGNYFALETTGFFTDDFYTDPATGERSPTFYLIYRNLSKP